jgi:hypothetical protein
VSALYAERTGSGLQAATTHAARSGLPRAQALHALVEAHLHERARDAHVVLHQPADCGGRLYDGVDAAEEALALLCRGRQREEAAKRGGLAARAAPRRAMVQVRAQGSAWRGTGGRSSRAGGLFTGMCGDTVYATQRRLPTCCYGQRAACAAPCAAVESGGASTTRHKSRAWLAERRIGPTRRCRCSVLAQKQL